MELSDSYEIGMNNLNTHACIKMFGLPSLKQDEILLRNSLPNTLEYNLMSFMDNS